MPEMYEPYDIMIGGIMPDLALKFQQAALDYGDAFEELGLKGQYSDMHRKMKKLKRAIWDGETLTRESVEEIMGDLFGHVLISLYLLRQTEPERDVGGGIEDSIPAYAARILGPDETPKTHAEITPTERPTPWDVLKRYELAEITPQLESQIKTELVQLGYYGELTLEGKRLSYAEGPPEPEPFVSPQSEEELGRAADAERARLRDEQLDREGASAPPAVERGAAVWEQDDA